MKHSIPTTEETRRALIDEGGDPGSIPESEAEARMVLAIVQLEDDPEWSPVCFRKEFDTGSELCDACTLRAPCWTGDLTYLKGLEKGDNAPPDDAPKVLVSKALTRVQHGNRKVPPKPKK